MPGSAPPCSDYNRGVDGGTEQPSAPVERARQVAAVVLDLLAIGCLIWLLPPLVARLADPHWLNALLIAMGYLAMCGGLVLARTYAPKVQKVAAPEKEGDQPIGGDGSGALGCALATAIPFSIFVAVMMLMASGALDGDASWLDQFQARLEASAILSILGVVGFFVFMGLFPWALLYQPRRRAVRLTWAGFTAQLLGLLGVNAMVLVTAAFWQSLLTDAEPMGLALGGRLLVFALSYVVLLLFYAPPRLALLSIAGGQWSLLSFLVMLGVMLWPLTA